MFEYVVKQGVIFGQICRRLRGLVDVHHDPLLAVGPYRTNGVVELRLNYII